MSRRSTTSGLFDQHGNPWPPIVFAVAHEQLPGEGEDAPPLEVAVGPAAEFVAVFDGLGGSGSVMIDSPEGSHSGAYFASRLAREIVEDHIASLPDRHTPVGQAAVGQAAVGQAAGREAPASAAAAEQATSDRATSDRATSEQATSEQEAQAFRASPYPTEPWDPTLGLKAAWPPLESRGGTERAEPQEPPRPASAFTPPKTLHEDLRAALQAAFARRASEWSIQQSRIRSSLLRVLPTTMAGALTWVEPSGAGWCSAYWAGDSRAFMLTPGKGLQQLTRDDIRSGRDALDNLTSDSPISNCVNASSDFTIHVNTVPLAGPCVVLAATDGCFGFLLTPAHFEELLLATLQEAADQNDWADRIRARITAVTGDDATLSAAAIGWASFHALRAAFRRRLDHLRQRSIDPLVRHARQLEQLRGEVHEQERLYEAARGALWRTYRDDYEELLQASGDET